MKSLVSYILIAVEVNTNQSINVKATLTKEGAALANGNKYLNNWAGISQEGGKHAVIAGGWGSSYLDGFLVASTMNSATSLCVFFRVVGNGLEKYMSPARVNENWNSGIIDAQLSQVPLDISFYPFMLNGKHANAAIPSIDKKSRSKVTWPRKKVTTRCVIGSLTTGLVWHTLEMHKTPPKKLLAQSLPPPGNGEGSSDSLCKP